MHTDGTGLGTIDTTVSLPSGKQVITATATGPDGTSEFSRCLVPSPSKSAGPAVAPGSLSPNGQGDVSLDVWCLAGTTCSGAATLQTSPTGTQADIARVVVLGSAHFHGKPGSHANKVEIKLTKAGRKLLAKRHQLTVTARVTTKGHHNAATFVLSAHG